MNIEHGFVFLFHFVRNFRESASLSKHFGLTACSVYPQLQFNVPYFLQLFQLHFAALFQIIFSKKLAPVFGIAISICRDFSQEVNGASS